MSPRSTHRDNVIPMPRRPSGPGPEQLLPVLTKMAQLAVSARSASQVRRQLLGAIHPFLKARASYIAMPDGRGNLAVIEAKGAVDHSSVSALEGGVLRELVEEGRTVRRAGRILVPIPAADGRLIGCLVLIEPGALPDEPVLATLAAQLGAGLAVADLRDDAIRRQRDLKTAVAGLKRLERAREELFRNVSQDIKNPLTALKAGLSVLARGRLGALTEEQQGALGGCDRHADRLHRMVDDLLLLSRLRSGKMRLAERPFGLKAMAHQLATESAAHATSREVHIPSPAGDELFVRGDPQRLGEAVEHLLDCLIRLSEPGDTLRIRLSTQGDSAEIAFEREGEGEALPAGELETLLDLSGRPRSLAAKLAGGLDIPIAARILQLHGGRLEVLRDGSRDLGFLARLPLFAGAVRESPQRSEPVSTSGVLLVEDDPDCREAIHEVLTHEGYHVMDATGVQEALSVLETTRPGLVLLDLRLRDGDGRQVLRRIRETPHLSTLPVYAVSGASDVEGLTSDPLERFDGVFKKPLKLGQLLDTVAAAVRPQRHS